MKNTKKRKREPKIQGRFSVGERAWTTWTARETWQRTRFNVGGKKVLVTLLGRKSTPDSANGFCYRVRLPECCNTCGSTVIREHELDEGWFLKLKSKR